MKDLLGQAILDYFNGDQQSKLYINNSYDVPEEMPVEVYFRPTKEFSELEKLALSHCQGKILDIGAAAGDKVLALQDTGHEVFALDISEGCAEVMKDRGAVNVILQDFYTHTEKYDTLLLLMNGLGLAKTLNEIPEFLKKCRSLSNSGGQIIFDSSDIKYLYEDHPDIEVPYPYYGDIRYQYEYEGIKGDWFEWVYADHEMMGQIVEDSGLKLEVLMEDEFDQYLGRITGF